MEKLVSKKDLLVEKNISYGQLYRWKRKGLIPEKWFINVSTETGQETFFEKDKIYTRLDSIIKLKDDMTLDEMRFYLSNEILENVEFSREMILNKNIVNFEILEIYEKLYVKEFNYDFLDFLYMYLASDLISTYDIDIETVFKIIEKVNENYKINTNFEFKISIYKKLGIIFTIIHRENSIYYFDGDIVVEDYDINLCVKELKKELKIKVYEDKSRRF